MGEEVKKNESWDARWLTIPEFADALPVNLFHKEQVQPAFEGEKTAELQNVHVFVRGHFTLECAQKIFCKITADDHYKAYLDGKFMGEGPAVLLQCSGTGDICCRGVCAGTPSVLSGTCEPCVEQRGFAFCLCGGAVG